MIARNRFKKTSGLRSALLPLAGLLALAVVTSAATRSGQIPVAPQWERFEATFKSRVKYTNAIQQATLTVTFVSPTGETNTVPGFWDGARNWRVRFAPGAPGRWTYLTSCSDTANTGLHAQAGAFLCSAAKHNTRFGLHGPIHVAEGGRRLEHADHTPWFWIGETAPEAVRRAALKHLEILARVRSSQKFNAMLWSLWPGTDDRQQAAFHGRQPISINVDFFKRLDLKVDMLNRAGLLNAVAPLWEIGLSAEDTLPEDQAILLMRYAVARWGANDTAWVLAFEGGNVGKPVDRWQRIGRAVFGDPAMAGYAPVILLPGETTWVMNEFRHENWVNAFGFQTAQVLDENSLQWLLAGPLTLERHQVPLRPLITLSPPVENAPTRASGKIVDADHVRRLMWWSALLNTPAGVSYSAHAVANWDATVTAGDGNFPADWPAWRKGLFLPGARGIETVIDLMGSIDLSRLQPMPQALTEQPGTQSPRRFIAVTGTEAKDLILVYVPEDRSVNLVPTEMPQSPSGSWINPRTGEQRAAKPVVGANGQFQTPGAGDWLLVIKAGN